MVRRVVTRLPVIRMGENKPMSDDKENVLVDAAGNPADDKARFEFSRKVIGKKVLGFRFHTMEEYEEGKLGNTIILQFEDDAQLVIAVESPAKIQMFLSMKPGETGPDWVQ